MSCWKNIKVEKKLISEPIENGLGWVHYFITLPKNDLYGQGYGFFISDRLVTDDGIVISDDFNVELQMNPSLRDKNKRYKRFKVSGGELMETILLPHMANLEAKMEVERNRRNKKTVGRIVYGRYLGNTYGEDGDSAYDVYFARDGIYYNGRDKHEKVENVHVKLVITDKTSKYDYEQNVKSLRERMKDWQRIDNAISELKKIENPDESLEPILRQLEACKQSIITQVTTLEV